MGGYLYNLRGPDRLSKITRRTGDSGETGLGDGSRLPKDSARVQALGDVDELNSALGVLLAEEVPEDIREALGRVQQDLFDLGGELSIPGHAMLNAQRIAELEKLQEAWNAELAPLIGGRVGEPFGGRGGYIGA